MDDSHLRFIATHYKNSNQGYTTSRIQLRFSEQTVELGQGTGDSVEVCEIKEVKSIKISSKLWFNGKQYRAFTLTGRAS
jgi:hypothetical protein